MIFLNKTIQMKFYFKRSCSFITIIFALFITIVFGILIVTESIRLAIVEYEMKHFNFSKVICQVGDQILPDLNEECTSLLKNELYQFNVYQLPLLLHSNVENLPTYFDGRNKWPFCKSVREIRDQGSCGSCWAVAVTSAITDRVCIHSKGRIETRISEQDLLTCCKHCGRGCQGGNSVFAWKYWKNHGIVSGASYGAFNGCKPYTFPPCIHFGKNKTCIQYGPTPVCIESCQQHYYKTYTEDLNFGSIVYSIINKEQQIMKEIIENGPVQANMILYSDFVNYKSGIYSPSRQNQKKISEHSIKIIGWGAEENTGTKYWLCANSFNTNWGENGFFRVKRGNTCDIQSKIFAGLPRFIPVN